MNRRKQPFPALHFWWTLVLLFGLLTLLFFFYVLYSYSNKGERAAFQADTIDADSAFAMMTAGEPLDSLPVFSPQDSLFLKRGFVNLYDFDTLLCIDQRYASENNFAARNLYGAQRGCWLHAEAARKLVAAARNLRESSDSLRLLVFDAARPQSVQFQLYAAACSVGACRYVAAPWAGSVHNFGFAVDVGLADANCRELDLGTGFDSFDSLAQPRYESIFLRRGTLDSTAWRRRGQLRKAMRVGGFRRIDLEWWHFEALSIDTARKYHPIVP